MKLARKLIILATLLLLYSCGNAADAISAIGLSFDQYAGNPGYATMFGTEFNVNDNGSIRGRLLYVNDNYNFALDKTTLDGIGYFDIWKLKVGIHGGGTYETISGEYGLVTGGEIRKSVSVDLGQFHLNHIFVSGDMLWRKHAPTRYFVITIGAVFRP